MAPKKKILICEDDRDFARVLLIRLTHAGFEVGLAVDSLQVMQMARKNAPDCIVLDLNMPGGRGPEIVRRLEDNAQTAATPVILMSGKDPDLSLFSEFYHDRFIKKPFEVTLLIDMINQLLQTDPSDLSKENDKQN